MPRITLTLIAAFSLTLTLHPLHVRASPIVRCRVLTVGKTTLHLYSVPGVLANGQGLDTFFSCTSTDTATMQVGVELFSFLGWSTNQRCRGDLPERRPGATVTFATGAAAGISINSNLAGGNGSARILATSKKLACTAFVADNGNALPRLSFSSTIIAKLKQKAAN